MARTRKLIGQSFVSMSSWVVHRDEAYFPNPDKFDPTRWLDPKEARRIDKALISFCKGTRGCVGIKYVSPPYVDIC